MMLMRLVLGVLLALCALVPREAGAGAASSGVHVRVTFAPPRQATAVTVRLGSELGAGPSRTLVVEPARPAWFGGLPEAEYSLSVTAPGLPQVDGRVRVGVDEIVSVQVLLPASGEAIVSVSSRWRAQEGTRFSGALLDDLPANGDVWSLVETAAPFAIVDRMDTGGMGAARSALVGSRGESWAMTSIAAGDSLIRFPAATGQLPITPAANAIESVSVASGLAPVEVATPGVYVRLAPRRPTSRAGFEGDASFTTPGFVGENATLVAPSIARLDTWRQVGVSGSGPLSERNGLFASVDSRRVTYTERGRQALNEAGATTAFAHLVRRVSDADEVRVAGGFERGHSPLPGRAQFLDRDAPSTTDSFGRVQATWDHAGAGGSRRSISIGGQSARSRAVVPTTAVGGVVDRVLDGVVPMPASLDRRFQWNVRAELGRAPLRTGGIEHGLRLGFSAERVRVQSSAVALPVVAEAVAGLPARVWLPIAPALPSTRGLTDAALYVSDRMAMGDTVVVDLGIRASASYGLARGAERGVAWVTSVPRLAFRWQPRRFAVFGGFGEYVAADPLALAGFGDPGAVSFDVHRWNDANGDRRLDAGETGVLVSRRGRNRSIATIDAGLVAPISRELSIGAEFHPTSRSIVGGAIIIRRTRRLVGSVNDGVPFSTYRLFTVPDIGEDEGHPADDQFLPIYERQPSTFGADQYRLTNPERPDTTYGGVELTWNIEGDRWNMLFGAMAYRTRGWGGDLGFGPFENDQLVIGERYENPNADDDVAGSFIFDRSYVGKWAGTYRAPGDVRFAFVARYQDGQPFTRYVVAPDLAGGPEIVHAYRVGRTRFTYTATVDARFEKGITIGGHRAAIRFDVFNLTNHANEVEEDVISGPSFRRSTALQPPRTARLGLTFAF